LYLVYSKHRYCHFSIIQMAAAAILDCRICKNFIADGFWGARRIIVPNYVKIGCSVGEISYCNFSNFQDGRAAAFDFKILEPQPKLHLAHFSLIKSDIWNDCNTSLFAHFTSAELSRQFGPAKLVPKYLGSEVYRV